MKARLGFGLVLATLVAGCGAPLDPTGNWSITVTPGTGNCNLGSGSGVFTITEGPEGYLMSGSNPSVTVTGTVKCDLKECKLSVVETQTGVIDEVTVTMSISYNLTSDIEDKITGSGTASATGDNGKSCSQAFTASGTKT